MTSPPNAEPTSPPPRPVARLSRRRRWLFRLVTLLAVAIGQEGLFRALFPTPEVAGFNRINYQQMAQSHPQIGQAMKRGLVYDRLLIESRPDGFAEVHDLNLYGFRGPDFRVDPAPGRRRILVIGDSVVEGQGVDDGATIAAAWSRLLAGDGTPAEVINLGVIAASLPHLWILTRDAVLLLKPTDVVVALYPNDLPAPFVPSLFNAPAPAFPRRAEGFRPRIVDLIGRAILEEPIHRRWFHLPIRFFSPVPDGTNPWSDGRPRPASLREDLYEDMKAGRLNPWLYAQSQDAPGQLAHDFATGGSPVLFLDRMSQVCRQAGARMMVAYTPFGAVVNPRYAPALVDLGMDRATAESLSVDPKYRNQNRVLAAVCEELKLPLADATAALEAAEASAPQYWPYDTHPNALGYATIARRIHEVWKATAASAAPSP
ncbi:SGNH/GDSL hydrolase family protein [Paludisphaera soli]|uniref:SGNH/GDSL hydrolase family protein n=1 Tax=Paludisphaera soli TaxID=2712865 RepID=UPI0013EDC6D2|nr:SGNH/GDSL hydrolase family protein [Paludisphaera soli]